MTVEVWTHLPPASGLPSFSGCITSQQFSSDQFPLLTRKHPFLAVISSIATITVQKVFGPSEPRAILRDGESK